MLFRRGYIIGAFISLGVLLYTPCLSQESYDITRKYSKEALVEDVDYLAGKLVQAHPGLYWYTTPEEFAEAVQTIKKEINGPLTEAEFLQHIAKLNVAIKCVHTDIDPSQRYLEWLSINARFIPFNLMRLRDKYYIVENVSNNEELSHAEVISINGQEISAIVEQLLPYIPADGDNQTRKYSALNWGFTRYYNLYIDPTAKKYELTYQTFSGLTSTKVLKGISRTDFLERRAVLRKKANAEPPVTFDFIDSLKTSVLTISTFRSDLMDKAGIDYYDFMAEVFLRLKQDEIGFEHLVIDLRNNGGGYSEYGAILNSYLADTSFIYCKNQVLTADSLLPGFSYEIPETFEGFPEGIIYEEGRYKWPEHSILGWRKREENAFTGQVYFLINGGGVSTTSEFASVAHYNKLGIFIGEEVGGSYIGDCGGVIGTVTLPNTHITADIAIVKYELAIGDTFSAHGVIPDYPVTPTIEDIRNGRDTVMEYVMEMIREGR